MRSSRSCECRRCPVHQQCGQTLARPYPQCGTVNAPDARYCRQCGTRLAADSTPTSPTALAPASARPPARAYAAGLRPTIGIDFAIRVGLNTGPVVVSQVGTPEAFEHTAMGDAANLAARLQATAQPMQILTTEATWRQIAWAFECRDLGPMDIRGKTEPVRVVEVRSARPRLHKARGLSGLTSPLVGRDAELAALLRVSQAVRAGLGRAVVISGEAGLGKSRLIEEWRHQSELQSEASRLHWVTGQCLSYGSEVAFHLVTDLLRAFLGLGADEERLEDALAQQLKSLLGSDEVEISAFLGHLPGLQNEKSAREGLLLSDPQALRRQYEAAFR